MAELFNEFPKPVGAADSELPVVALLFTRVDGGFSIIALNVCDAGLIDGYGNKDGSDRHFHTQLPDLALVSVNCVGLEIYALEVSTFPVSVGTEIATAGFPQGHALLAPYGIAERFGPALQRGIISAESPFQGAEPHAYLIDVMVQGGASGSPVFRVDNGAVIGVVFATQRDNSKMNMKGESLWYQEPTSFTHVVPAAILVKLMAESASHLLSTLPANSPSIQSMIASMPKNATSKITRGVYTSPIPSDPAAD